MAFAPVLPAPSSLNTFRHRAAVRPAVRRDAGAVAGG